MGKSNLHTRHRRKIIWFLFAILGILIALAVRTTYLMVYYGEEYSEKAKEIQEREREIGAPRGRIFDRNGELLAGNKDVCSISVIHNQIKDKEAVIKLLSETLEMEEEKVKEKVEKLSVREKIKNNVSKEAGEKILAAGLEGIKVDEDYARFYPYHSMASKVIGFTGGENQGVVGVEVKYDEILRGTPGKLYTMTDARGNELPEYGELRREPVRGGDLTLTLDIKVQQIVTRIAKKAYRKTQAKRVSVILMNPQNGEIYSMVNIPEYDLNSPFNITKEWEKKNIKDVNEMWRNPCINDTYEPGSTFKTVTATLALENHLVTKESRFYCPGYIVVEDRRIRCHKTVGHGSLDFVHGTMSSCNPVFITLGQRIGVEKYYQGLKQLGLLGKTGIDLPGEAGTIMHKKEKMGNVELATVSFGQSFQITPLMLIRTVSAMVNGGKLVTPHVAMLDKEGTEASHENGTEASHENATEVSRENGTEALSTETANTSDEQVVISAKTCETMKEILDQVVSPEGSGKNGEVEGYSMGGKTATSEKLPRGNGKYISSYLGFTPVDNPKVIGICIIDEPVGEYYGGTVAAPVLAEIYQKILPILGVEKTTESTETS